MKQNHKIYFFAALAVVAALTALASAAVNRGSTAVADVCLSAEAAELTESPASSQAALAEPNLDDTTEAFYEIYKPYGVSFDEEKQTLYFEGDAVRCFWDGVYIEEGIAVCRCNYFNKNGKVDIHSLREAVDNGDGSIDLFGILTGIEKSSQKEFEERDLSEFYRTDMLEATTVESSGSFRLSDLFTQKKTFADIFKKYKGFGLIYLEAEGRSGVGNLFYNGQPVNAFIDEGADGVFTFQSIDGGEINVQTVYDDKGKLAGLQVVDYESQ
ncbi:MAG: hypothetical protein NC400_05745 [Clostridium sp.]|nr:hypothetical protein [Clostridium sp.]